MARSNSRSIHCETPTGEYRKVWSGLLDEPIYHTLPPRSRWVLGCVLLTLPAPFPSALDRQRVATLSGLSVASVDAGLVPCIQSGLLIPCGDLFDVATVNGRPLVVVPPHFHVRTRRVRRRIPRRIRDRVFERDGYRCRHCGRADYLEIDHVEPWALGGSDEESNLQTLCSRCNRAKGPSAFVTTRARRGGEGMR